MQVRWSRTNWRRSSWFTAPPWRPAHGVATLTRRASAGEHRDRSKLAGGGSADTGVKDLVIAKYCRNGIRPPAVVGDRADRVEQAAADHKPARHGALMHPHGGQCDAS